MENNLRKIILSEFETGDDTVEAIEILFKEKFNTENCFEIERQENEK